MHSNMNIQYDIKVIMADTEPRPRHGISAEAVEKHMGEEGK